MRKSVAAWQLLQRMNQPEVALIFNGETARFHFLQHCRVMDQVDDRSVTLLMVEGYARRERSSIPVYTITDKGRAALRHRNAPEELGEPDGAKQEPELPRFPTSAMEEWHEAAGSRVGGCNEELSRGVTGVPVELHSAHGADRGTASAEDCGADGRAPQYSEPDSRRQRLEPLQTARLVQRKPGEN